MKPTKDFEKWRLECENNSNNNEFTILLEDNSTVKYTDRIAKSPHYNRDEFARYSDTVIEHTYDGKNKFGSIIIK